MEASSIRRMLVVLGAGAVLLAATSAGAIETRSRRPDMMAGIHILSAVPQGDFQENIEGPGWGLGGEYLVRLPSTVLWIGPDLGFYIYGSEERTEPFSETIPDVRVRVETSNNLLQGGLVVRVAPPAGSFRPFLDGYIGFNYLFTSTAIKYRDSGEEIASDTNFDDGTICYGGGGGFLIDVYSNPDNVGGVRSVSIDLRGRYIAGGEAEYLKEGSIIREGSNIIYETYRSETNMVQIAVGVTIGF